MLTEKLEGKNQVREIYKSILMVWKQEREKIGKWERKEEKVRGQDGGLCL